MSNSIHLEYSHYAAKWTLPKEGEFNDLQVVNQLGINYAQAKDGLDKEAKLLEIVKCFHGYVFKYTDLIVRGHLPLHNYNADTRRFLKYFLPADATSDRSSFAKAAKHLHLAFPQQSPTDVYDILNTLLLRCVKKYDPIYVDKVRIVVKIIGKLLKKKLFTINDITSKVKFDPTGSIRLLARKGYIKAIRGSNKKLIGYKITSSWPPSKEFLNSGPIGFVYFVQTWFRYYLQEHIDEQMKTLEARAWDKMLQLEHRSDGESEDSFTSQDTPNNSGEITDAEGHSWSADLGLIKQSLDIPNITPAWVQGTTDSLFSKMTLKERQLIYLYYVAEAPWKQIAENLEMSINQVQKIHNEILVFLKGKFGVKNAMIGDPLY